MKTQQEIYNALLTIKEVCEAQEGCKGCPLCSKDTNICAFVDYAKITEGPSAWVLSDPREWRAFE